MTDPITRTARTTRRRPPRQRPRLIERRTARRGVTIVEILVSVMVLSVGILGLAGSATVVTRLMDGGDQQTTAAVMAQDRFERLRATRCAMIASGTATANGMTERWSVEAAPIGTGAPRYEVVDSISYSVRGQAQPAHVHRSIVECLP